MKITPEEIANAHHEHCLAEHHCYGCKYYNRDVKCAFTFSLDYITKKSLEKVDAQALKSLEKVATDTNVGRKNGKDTNVSTNFPAWCKVGAWVVDKQGNICEITRLGYPHKAVRVRIPKDGCVSLSFEGRWLEEIVPVKFRPYEYAEAKALFGKVMELVYENGDKCTMLIDCIDGNERRVDVNGYKQEFLMKRYSATIDGVPFGVPEVDEEAMKEVK